MKGMPPSPMRLFRHGGEILSHLGVKFKAVDVLEDPKSARHQELSNWPTIPQLYVKGEFVGGADICAKCTRR